MRRKDYQVVGNLGAVLTIKKKNPDLNFTDIEDLLGARAFTNWYKKNKKVINMLAMVTPSVICYMFGVTPAFVFSGMEQAIPCITGGESSGGLGFFRGEGKILLHMLIAGFLTVVVTTFLKFTGRGDLIPLVVFVAGGIILKEVLALFQGIYNAVSTFLEL
jgi:hypothetical protein